MSETKPTTDRPSDQTDTPDGMRRVTVLQNFSLGRPDGTLQTFTVKGTNCGLPGVYDMVPDDAEHWWTKVNSDEAPPLPPPMAGTPRAAEEEHVKIQRRAIAEHAVQQEQQRAVDRDRRGRQRSIADKLGNSFEQAP